MTLCVERSPLMVVAVLGILKAGGVYVPLDPSDPRARLLDGGDGAARVVVAATRLTRKIARGIGAVRS